MNMNKRERARKERKNVNHPGIAAILGNTPALGVMSPRRHPHNDKTNILGQKCNRHFLAKMPLRQIFRLSKEAVKENFQNPSYFYNRILKTRNTV